MKVRSMLAAILSIALGLTMLSGCSDDSGKGGESFSGAQSADAASDEKDIGSATPEEPDFMAFLIGESDTDFYNMSFEEFSNATGGQFSAENALEFSDDSDNYAKYTLGEKDSILGGRVKLDKEREVFCNLSFQKDKLKRMELKIEGLTVEEADKICADYLAAFDGKLPEGYECYPPLEHGNIYEVGYVGKVDDYIASMRRDRDLSDDYYILFTLEVYAERYGMD